MDRQNLFALVLLAVVVGGVAFFFTTGMTSGHEPPRAQLGAFVQLGGARLRMPKGEEYSDVVLPTERDEVRRLEQISQLIDEGHYSDAVVLLDRVLGKDEDSFFVPGDVKTNFRSLKSEALRMIGELPAKGQEAYQLQFGARAEKMLAEAVRTGDVTVLTEISRRYFHTVAGYEATFLLGRHHLDHGRPLAAAICYEQLLDTSRAVQRFEPTLSILGATCWLRSGMDGRAMQTLVRLKRRDPNAQVQIAEGKVRLFTEDGNLLTWLENTIGKQLPAGPQRSRQWTTFRGDASRNGKSVGGRPLLAPRWRVRIANDPTIEKVVKQMQQSYASQGIAALPSLHPLAVDDVVLMRTARKLLAVDFRTGKRAWEVKPYRDDFDRLIDPGYKPSRGTGVSQLAEGLEQRLWNDMPYGTLSSDGRRVFAIQDLGLLSDGFGRYDRQMIRGLGRMRTMLGTQTMSNRLSAFELRSQGKLLWEVGGADSEIEELQEAFFLGPPLAVSGALYALVEIRGGIRLVVLEPTIDSATARETVKLVWSQQLADVEQSIFQDPVRRLSGATPSFADGVLVCPTSAGAVVAVDLARRSLLWAYKYKQGFSRGNRRLQALQWSGSLSTKANNHWVDATATVVEDRVLLTPIESREIHCLNLMDGKLLWKRDRGENLYVACAHEGKVVLVGQKSMTALQLADGRLAWQQTKMPLPEGSLPSGRGFYSGKHYYLPLSSAEVAQVDLDEGKIVDLAKSRDGIIPGNLICYRDEVVSLGVDSLDAFFQIEPLRERVAAALQVDPNDAESLARMGEIELDQERLEEAIDYFRRSFDLAPSSLTRELLVQSLLKALRKDFTANQDAARQLESLIDQPEQRVMLLRLIAEGLQKAYQRLEAFEIYLKLVDMQTDEDKLFEINSHLSVRRDRWIQTQLVSLRSSATAEERTFMDREIQSRRAALGRSATVSELRRFLAHFSGNPAADEVRRSLAENLLENESPLECEALLLQLEHATDGEHRRAATAMMAKLLHGTGPPEHAAVYYRRLAGELSETVCLAGQTGKEIFASLPEDDLVRKLIGGHKDWPSGEVKVSKLDTQSILHRSRNLINIPVRDDRRSFFDNTSVSLDQTSGIIVGYDGYGKKQFQAPLRRPYRSQRINRVNSNTNYYYGVARGHLLLMSLGDRVFAFDTLRNTGTEWDKVLWDEDLIERIPGIRGNRQISPKSNAVVGGRPRYRAMDMKGRTVGILGPITKHGVTFQSQGDLECVDPLTGTLLWVRRGIPQGSDLFGDDEVLLVAPPGASEAQVFRARDGSLLGKCDVPPESERMATLGRRVLQAIASRGKFELKLIDPWEKSEIWTRSFNASRKTRMLEGNVMGVMETSGRFVLLSLIDGRTLVDEQLEAEPKLKDIYLMRDSDRYFLITNRSVTRNARNVLSVPRRSGDPVVNGHVYAFDRRTFKLLWPAPATVLQRVLVATQPSELPVLTFVQQIRRVRTGRQPQTRTTMLCLDKRTGRNSYEADNLKVAGGLYRLLGNPDDGTVSLITSTSTVKLKFTDDPISPEPPHQDHLEGSGGQRKRGIFGIFGAATQERDDVRMARQAVRPGRAARQQAERRDKNK